MYDVESIILSDRILSDSDFSRLSNFIHDTCGIKMPPIKKTMLEGRLYKRMRKLGMKSISEYCEYLFSPQGVEHELVHMIDVITTNKTDFFREPKHFDYLVQEALPELISGKRAGIRKQIKIWSAGCSTGEEPYSIAMLLSEYAEKNPEIKLDYSILATDISTSVLQKGKLAIYDEEKIEDIPDDLKKKCLLQSRKREKCLIRIAPELRESVRFQKLNIIDNDFRMNEQMDIIFCRNVFIYFDKTTQEIVLNRFHQQLNPGGYLFLGHSETLHGFNVNFIQIEPTIYRKPLDQGNEK